MKSSNHTARYLRGELNEYVQNALERYAKKRGEVDDWQRVETEICNSLTHAEETGDYTEIDKILNLYGDTKDLLCNKPRGRGF